MAESSRYRPEIMTCIEWARQGKFGTIFYSESEYHHPGDNEYSYGDSFDCQSCHLERYDRGEEYKAVPTWSYGLPPMLYPTHCTGRIIPVIGERLVESSRWVGETTMRVSRRTTTRIPFGTPRPSSKPHMDTALGFQFGGTPRQDTVSEDLFMGTRCPTS